MRSLDVGLTVTDDRGQAVKDAAVAVTAVDEGVCSLTNFATPDPLAFFTARRALGVRTADVYGLLMPETARADVGGDSSDADRSGSERTGTGGVAACIAPATPSKPRHHSPIGGTRVRPVALGWTTVHTDAAGHARASFPVPAFQAAAAGDGRRPHGRPRRVGRPGRGRPIAAAGAGQLAAVRRARRSLRRAAGGVQQPLGRRDGARRRDGRRRGRPALGRSRRRGRRGGCRRATAGRPRCGRRSAGRRGSGPPPGRHGWRGVRRRPGAARPPGRGDEPVRRRRPRGRRPAGAADRLRARAARDGIGPGRRHAAADAEPAGRARLPRPLSVRLCRADDQHPVPAGRAGRDRPPHRPRPLRPAAGAGQGRPRRDPTDRHADGRRRTGHVARGRDPVAVGQRLRGRTS